MNYLVNFSMLVNTPLTFDLKKIVLLTFSNKLRGIKHILKCSTNVSDFLSLHNMHPLVTKSHILVSYITSKKLRKFCSCDT